MININKYIVLYSSFLALLLLIIFGVNKLRDNNILLQKDVLLKQARTHFQDQVNTRKWNALHGSVYVKPNRELKPNKYLKDNTLKTDKGETLIRINPAWMTRQLSELLTTGDFHFKITSETPINPINKADEFEKRALKYVRKNSSNEYFELNENEKYRYLGALIIEKSCLPCHEHQGYKIGDIRGGISISLSTDDYEDIVTYVMDRAFIIKMIIIFLLTSILLLIHKQFRNNENLQDEVFKQTKEIRDTKKLLQEVLDTDHNFLMVADGKKIILANKTMLDFFNVSSLEVFLKKYGHISSFFITEEDEEYLSDYIDGEHWLSYLNNEQKNKDLKILMNKDNKKRYFKPHTKELTIDNRKLNIIIFDDITKELVKINSLEEKAAKDDLTNLFNRGKFNEVLSGEISLSKLTSSQLSIIFLDIDYFKTVNDKYGHDAGDYVLIELAKILESSVRKNDFVARWGGEEFIILMQSTNAQEAYISAEKIRKYVESYNFFKGGNQTVSLGVTQYNDNEPEADFIKRVDDALYEAKESGRNKTVTK